MQVDASSRKLNFYTDLRLLANRTRKFTRKRTLILPMLSKEMHGMY